MNAAIRGRVPWGVLAVLFVAVPLLELWLLVQSSGLVGLGPTILLLILDSLLGAYLLKREGASAWRRLRAALAAARIPARELADGALVLVGGTLLLTPGFMTDALGFFFILPFTRPLARRALTGFITRKLVTGPQPAPHRARTGRRPGHENVVRGEVVDD